MINVCVLSPHRDDAAFSCGLLMLSLLALGAEISIANVCTISAYAPYVEADLSDRVEQVTRARAAEDQKLVELLASMSRVSAERINLTDLEWQDAPLRKKSPDQDVLRSPVDPQERFRLGRDFENLDSASVLLIPAGVGGHVDHLLVREAALATFSANKILLYEDLPYTCRQQEHRPSQVPLDLREWLGPAVHTKAAKRALALNYPSQIERSVAEEMQSYADVLGGRERFYGNPEAVRTLSAAFRTQDVSA